MKVVILAGGLGTRLGEETGIKPKPMVTIGNKPILWHIMKIYSYYGFDDFIILTGYKHEVIKEYFLNYFSNNSDLTINLSNNEIEVNSCRSEKWKVTICYTGKNSMTGSRIKQIKKYINGESFLLTYGDGVSDVNINELIKFHKKNGKLCTLTAVQPEGRFGVLKITGDCSVCDFSEKPKNDDTWINSGFFVCESGVFDYIDDGIDAVWESSALSALAREGQLNAFKHFGFWRPMDMLKDKEDLNKIWESGEAPWAIWDKVI